MNEIHQDIDDLLEIVAELLIHNEKTVATAESCTGGLLGHTLTNYPGSSSYYEQGVISYSNQAKMDLLGVSEHDLERFGAVSRKVAQAMAEGVKQRSRVDIGVSTTGIAGPSGGSEEKPVGLVYIGLAMGDDTVVNRYEFQGNRLENKQQTVYEAFILLRSYLTALS